MTDVEKLLTIYVVYDRPKDFPTKIVVRARYATRDGAIRPSKTARVFDSIEQAQSWCSRKGLYRIERFPDDEPQIVEAWI